MKTIKYKKKQTTARTQYNETTSIDTQDVLNKCKRIVEVADACEKHNIADGKRLYGRNDKMPRQSNGKMNSPKSMCEGVIDNFNNGQYNISDPQIKGLSESFNVAHDIIEDFEQTIFEEVTTLPKLSMPSNIEQDPGTTFGDLFGYSVEEVRVTKIYRKQK